MSYRIFLDDERFPPNDGGKFLIARSSDECIGLMREHDCPDFISFDHDLGGEDTAIRVVKWMIDTDINHLQAGFSFIPDNFTFYVHSQNPIGAKNITELLNSYLRFRKENGNICV